jgi:RHS repeat-associated protein
MNDSNPVYFAVTASPLPSGWLDQDIGSVGVAGSAMFSSGVFTLAGAGGGTINVTADGLHFAYQVLSGDGTIIARIVSVSNTYAQAGVMIRGTLDAGSASMSAINYGDVIFGSFRTVSDSSSTYLYGPEDVTFPYWVKLVRAGNSIAGYTSPDGVSWTLIEGPMPIDMPQSVYIGLMVSGQAATAYTATFDNVSVSSTPNPAPQITGVSATTGSIGSQVTISGSGFGSPQGNSVVLLNDAPVTINSWSATSISVTIPSGATSGTLAVLVAPDLTSSNGVVFTVTTQPLLSGWLDQDVGVVGMAGNATYNGGVFTVQGAGSSVTGTADSFHFVYQPLASDGTIIARVVSQSVSSQAGVMIRETLDANAAELYTYGICSSGPTYTGYMGYRTFAGGLFLPSGPGSLTAPYWIKAVRIANAFSAYVSEDGSNWTQVGLTQTFSTPEEVYVGFGVSSGVTTTLASASFDSVSITDGDALPNPVVSSVSPVAGAPGTTVTIDGQGFGATQAAGSVVYLNGAIATVGSWSDSEIVVSVPDAVTTGPVSVTVGNITEAGPTFTALFAAQLTDSLGNHTSYSSSVAGGQWAVTNAQGSGCSSCTQRGTIQNQFGATGNLLWSSDALGNQTLYQYDSSSDITTQSQPLASGSAATTTYTYSNFGEVASMTDPLGHVTSNSYDSHGNLLSVTTPALSGGSASVTQFAYNSLGELTQITDPLSHVTRLTYTTAGLIATITDPQSNVTTYAYDSRGNRTGITDSLNHQTTFAYDAGNRLTLITYPDSSTMSFAYDYRGRRTSSTDQNGRTTSYAYDDADRLTSVTDAAQNATQYSYDTENNLLSITDANHHVTSFAYDAYGRVTQATFPSGYIESYAYDADNNLTSKTDRKGQTIQYVYDALNRLTQKTYPDSTSVEYVYDLAGKVQSVNDPTGSYTFTYDNMGRLIGTSTQYSFLPNQPLTNSYTYDANSNRTGYTAPDGSTNTYSYDTLNRLTSLSNSWAGSFGFTYDALSRRTQLSRPNGVTTSYSYDNLSRLLNIVHQLSGSTIDGDSYTLDSAGNRTSKSDALAGVTSNNTYDAIYELTQVTQAGAATESYSYDPVGNRLSSLGGASYTVNPSNELSSTSTASYTYDYNGNTTSKTASGNTTSYSWDFENRLTQVTLPNSAGTVSFKYDPFGRRIEKISPNATSIFLYNGDNLVETVNATGGVVARYTQGRNIDEPLAMERGTTTDFYEQDGVGSVTSLTASNGSVAQSYAYDSFGNLTNSSGSLTNFFRYTARDFDTETSLYNYRARYYDAVEGRFLSEDPIRFKAGSNFYAYVKNNPVMRWDPSGLIHQEWNDGKRDGRLHDDSAGGLEVLCTQGRNISSDIEWLLHSIEVRSIEIEALGNDADLGHITRLENEIATLERCENSCDHKPEPEPEPEPAPKPPGGPILPFLFDILEDFVVVSAA